MPENQKKVSFNIQISQNKSNQERPRSQPKMISHWYYGRLVTTFILIVMAIVAINTMLNTEPEFESTAIAGASLEKSNSLAELSLESKQPADTLIKGQTAVADSKIITPKATTASVDNKPVKDNQTKMAKAVNKPSLIPAIANGVLRSQLAMGLWENEPFGDVALPLKVTSSAATGLFYFTELQGLQGQSVYHVWKRQGRIIFQQKKQVATENFRTHTSKLFTMASIGSWTVSITDSDLVPLHTIEFTVVAE